MPNEPTWKRLGTSRVDWQGFRDDRPALVGEFVEVEVGRSLVYQIFIHLVLPFYETFYYNRNDFVCYCTTSMGRPRRDDHCFTRLAANRDVHTGMSNAQRVELLGVYLRRSTSIAEQ